jgi:hypothetical protein
MLEPEPDNQYDEKAIKVLGWVGGLVAMRQFPSLREALEGTGSSLEDLLESDEPIHLGYLANSDAKTANSGPGNREVLKMMEQQAIVGLSLVAKLVFGPDGAPAVEVSPEEKEEEEEEEEEELDDEDEE